VVSAVIVVEQTKEGYALLVQSLVYYISQVLSETKAWHYFEAHPVTMVSSFPLGEIIRNPDAAGGIAK
jgi:F0F1-type ATP synthase assembly protein I